MLIYLVYEYFCSLIIIFDVYNFFMLFECRLVVDYLFIMYIIFVLMFSNIKYVFFIYLRDEKLFEFYIVYFSYLFLWKLCYSIVKRYCIIYDLKYLYSI